MPLSSGETFAGFRIVRLLGSGGMGEVYLAEHPRLPRHDALKILAADVSADPEYRARFNREADLASTLWHPHIVSVHDRGEYDGQLWISMDYVDGLDAARLLASRYPPGCRPSRSCASSLPWQVRWTTPTSKACCTATSNRPTSCSLILMTTRRATNLAGRLRDRPQRRRHQRADHHQHDRGHRGLRRARATDGRGHRWPCRPVRPGRDRLSPPHRIAALPALQSRGRHQPPPQLATPALADTRPELAALDPVLAAALAKDPGDRFARCADFARALAEQAAPSAASSAAPTTPAPASRKAASPAAEPPPTNAAVGGSTKRWLTVAIALAVIVLASAVALAWHPWQHGPSGNVPTSSSQPPPAMSSMALPTSRAAPPAPPVAGSSSAEPAGTEIITAVAVDASGQATNGYREAPVGTISELAGCDQPSPAAVGTNIYSCYPSAAAADVCWPSPPMSMLCMNNPWDKEVRRLTYDTSLLTTVQPPTTPEPFALTLDNGTHCRLITGGARRARNDGYVPFYACGADSTAAVLGDAGSQTDPINRSKPLWTVTFEQPGFQIQVRSVTTAWFAGT